MASIGPWQLLLTIARVAFDAAALAAATLLAFVARFSMGWFAATETERFDLSPHLVASLVWVGAVLGAMALSRLYDEDTLFPGGGELSRVLRSVIEGVAVLSIFVYFTHSFSVSRSWFAVTAILSAALLGGERLIMRGALRRERLRGRFRRPVILVSKNGGQQVRDAVAGVPEFDVVDAIGPQDAADLSARNPRAGGFDLIVAAGDFDEVELWRLVLDAGRSGRSVFLHSSVRSVSRDRLSVREIGDRELIKVAPPYLTGPRAFRKRSFDIVIGGALFVALFPLMLVIALATLMTSGLPVTFRQERVGKDSKRFTLFKFRTMRRDAEASSGPVWATEHDMRRTRLGTFLRRFSLDELPQLWNVLGGQMSLVGPRPERPTFVSRFDGEIAWYRDRHRIRPGITGWAQVHGLRGNTSLDPRVDHDNWYIENWSLSLDIRILIKTLGEVVRGRNAY